LILWAPPCKGLFFSRSCPQRVIRWRKISGVVCREIVHQPPVPLNEGPENLLYASSSALSGIRVQGHTVPYFRTFPFEFSYSGVFLKRDNSLTFPSMSHDSLSKYPQNAPASRQLYLGIIRNSIPLPIRSVYSSQRSLRRFFRCGQIIGMGSFGVDTMRSGLNLRSSQLAILFLIQTPASYCFETILSPTWTVSTEDFRNQYTDWSASSLGLLRNTTISFIPSVLSVWLI